MKKTVKILSLFCLAVFFVLSSLACTAGTTTTTTTGTEEVSLAGEYEIDITALGMPLIFYLKIDAEDNFFLSPDRTYAVDKGHGTIASSGETYMFLYSDSTPDTPKTSTFNVIDHNIYFIAALPYGASNLQGVDEENPEIIHYAVAKALFFEEYLGIYAGSHTGTDTIDYEYTLKLGTGCEYTFTSTYVSGSEPHEFIETGSFSIEGTVLTLVPDSGTAVNGTLNADDSIDIAVAVSDSDVPTERHLRFATTALYAGTYLGYLSEVVGETTHYATDATLVLDNFGGYAYSAEDGVSAQTMTETGTFSVAGSVFTFTPDEGTALTGSTANKFIVKAAFLVDPDSATRTQVWFYRSNIIGEFTGTTTVEEVDYEAVLNVYPDATFDLVITQVGGAAILTQNGTFTLGGFPLSLNLKVGTVTTPVIVSLANLQGNFTASEVEYGFTLVK